MNKKYYAITQYGYTIYGVGRTKLGALRHANQYLSKKTSLKEIESNNPSNRVIGEVYLVECTKRLYQDVKKYGGNISGVLSVSCILDIE